MWLSKCSLLFSNPPLGLKQNKFVCLFVNFVLFVSPAVINIRITTKLGEVKQAGKARARPRTHTHTRRMHTVHLQRSQQLSLTLQFFAAFLVTFAFLTFFVLPPNLCSKFLLVKSRRRGGTVEELSAVVCLLRACAQSDLCSLSTLHQTPNSRKKRIYFF